ncbi:serine-arginine protein 55-like [Diabrotica undecimpunctata]|uniref:serine-arginine protein 55-like n=1 Tax=Diabrotica undecimpunctata TaxID=50387 RepID=UPI003B641B4D
MVGSRVYVGGLPYGTSERDLERFFRGYGRMRDVLIKNGYGFVEFEDYRDADDAVYELNGKKLLGERVTVERARGTPRGRDQYSSGGSRSSRNDDRRSSNNDRYGPPTRTNYRLLVENLSSRISWQDLKDYMRQAGEVTYADAHKDHRNEGVVEFASYSDMKNAIEKLDDTELNGRKIRLVEDKKNNKSRRSASYSSRSRSRSRSRSARRSRSHSRSSRSKSKSRSRSRSQSAKDDREKSKSRSRSRSNSRKKSDRSRSNSRKKSVGSDHSRSRSHSRTPDDKRSKSREASKERSRSRSRSRSESKERSKSRSRSRSPN